MRKFLAIAFMAASLAWAKPASADPFLFDFNGTAAGGQLTLNAFSWLPGNTILLEDTNQILYQANYDFGGLACNTLFTGSSCLTAVALFNVAPGALPGSFDILPGGTFQIWADTAPANDLTGGTAFADGTLIMSSTPIGTGTASVVTCPPGAPLPNGGFCPALSPLDQFNADDWANYLTPLASGGFSNIQTTVNMVTLNRDYFIDPAFTGTGAAIITVSSGSNNLPYSQVDPTALFWNLQPGVPSLCSFAPTAATPCINGVGDGTPSENIMAESDANTTLDITPGIVPEPATLSLFGLGLVGLAAARRRQLRNKK